MNLIQTWKGPFFPAEKEQGHFPRGGWGALTSNTPANATANFSSRASEAFSSVYRRTNCRRGVCRRKHSAAFWAVSCQRAPTRRRDDSGDASSPTWGIIVKKATIVEVPPLTADEHQHLSVLCHTTKSLLTTNIFQAAVAA